MLPTLPPLLSSRRQVLTAGLLAAFGSAAVLDLFSQQPVSAAPIAGSSTRVSVVGDSLTIGTMPYQAGALAGVGWEHATIDAFQSRGVRTKTKRDQHTGLTSVDAIRSQSGDSDLWVVALGTNDAGIYNTAKHAEIIRMMMDRIGAGHYVMWVNVYLPATPPRQQHWNSALATVAADYPDQMFVFDWATLAADNRNWLATDEIHCSGKGYKHRSTAIAVASRSLIPSTAPDPGPYRTGRLWTQVPAGSALSG